MRPTLNARPPDSLWLGCFHMTFHPSWNANLRESISRRTSLPVTGSSSLCRDFRVPFCPLGPFCCPRWLEKTPSLSPVSAPSLFHLLCALEDWARVPQGDASLQSDPWFSSILSGPCLMWSCPSGAGMGGIPEVHPLELGPAQRRPLLSRPCSLWSIEYSMGGAWPLLTAQQTGEYAWRADCCLVWT